MSYSASVEHLWDTSFLPGRYKTWTLDSGLDSGLDHGLDYELDYGLDFGFDFGLDSTMYELTLCFGAFQAFSF